MVAGAGGEGAGRSEAVQLAAPGGRFSRRLEGVTSLSGEGTRQVHTTATQGAGNPARTAEIRGFGQELFWSGILSPARLQSSGATSAFGGNTNVRCRRSNAERKFLSADGLSGMRHSVAAYPRVERAAGMVCAVPGLKRHPPSSPCPGILFPGLAVARGVPPCQRLRLLECLPTVGQAASELRPNERPRSVSSLQSHRQLLLALAGRSDTPLRLKVGMHPRFGRVPPPIFKGRSAPETERRSQ
jgi:hypothetical protein